MPNDAGDEVGHAARSRYSRHRITGWAGKPVTLAIVVTILLPRLIVLPLSVIACRRFIRGDRWQRDAEDRSLRAWFIMWVFGVHLRRDDATRLGIDRGAHMRGILSARPRFIVVAGSPSDMTYGEASAVLAKALQHDYARVDVAFESGNQTVVLFERQDVAGYSIGTGQPTTSSADLCNILAAERHVRETGTGSQRCL